MTLQKTNELTYYTLGETPAILRLSHGTLRRPTVFALKPGHARYMEKHIEGLMIDMISTACVLLLWGCIFFLAMHL